MPKTTNEIIDWWDEGDNDDNHKDNKRWYSEEELETKLKEFFYDELDIPKAIMNYLKEQAVNKVKK